MAARRPRGGELPAISGSRSCSIGPCATSRRCRSRCETGIPTAPSASSMSWRRSAPNSSWSAATSRLPRSTTRRAPLPRMDPLSLSRHFRNFPGQGQLPLLAFLRAVLAAGYRGPLSLEIFNDDFRAAPARLIARDGLRSLILLASLGGGRGHCGRGAARAAAIGRRRVPRVRCGRNERRGIGSASLAARVSSCRTTSLEDGRSLSSGRHQPRPRHRGFD